MTLNFIFKRVTKVNKIRALDNHCKSLKKKKKKFKEGTLKTAKNHCYHLYYHWVLNKVNIAFQSF